MAVTFSELHTAEGLKALEAHLAAKTYISGDGISKDDIKVFAAVPTKPGAEFPNAARWYDTIAAATAARFPGKAGGVSASSAPAASAPAAAHQYVSAEDDFLLDLASRRSTLTRRPAPRQVTAPSPPTLHFDADSCVRLCLRSDLTGACGYFVVVGASVVAHPASGSPAVAAAGRVLDPGGGTEQGP
ncbi:hypothetical protein QYE76_043160 [Lolium multiflorum]|uniref:Elongation factor 1-beta n=1 Tax=Lolium multiflorum TaxID=4521 RepID=A0AAD8TIH2_LOLMU|nr:hypothetical protein QYE76_043160 [Lolium multiflorum]